MEPSTRPSWWIGSRRHEKNARSSTAKRLPMWRSEKCSRTPRLTRTAHGHVSPSAMLWKTSTQKKSFAALRGGSSVNVALTGNRLPKAERRSVSWQTSIRSRRKAFVRVGRSWQPSCSGSPTVTLAMRSAKMNACMTGDFCRPYRACSLRWFVTQGGARFTSLAGLLSFGPSALRTGFGTSVHLDALVLKGEMARDLHSHSRLLQVLQRSACLFPSWPFRARGPHDLEQMWMSSSRSQ